jgi:hypothetical protein
MEWARQTSGLDVQEGTEFGGEVPDLSSEEADDEAGGGEGTQGPGGAWAAVGDDGMLAGQEGSEMSGGEWGRAGQGRVGGRAGGCTWKMQSKPCMPGWPIHMPHVPCLDTCTMQL